MTQLGSLVDINPRSATPRTKGPLSVISVPDIDSISATARPRVIANLEAARSARRPAQPRDVLFARISPSMENGKVAIVPELETEQLVVSGELLVLRPHENVDPRLIWAFLRQPAVREGLRRFMTGSAGQQRLSADVLAEVDIPEPETRRWEGAANILERLDAARQLRSAIGDRVAALPAAAAESVGDHQVMQALGDFDVSFRYGTSERSSPQGSLPVLRIPNVVENRIDTDDLQYMSDAGSAYDPLEAGDLLVVRTNGNPERLGRVAVYEADPPQATFASYLIRARCRDLRPDFLWAWLQTGMMRSTLLGQARTTAGQYNLNIGQLGRLLVPRLETGEERKIAALARQARTLARLNDDQLALVDRAIVNHLALTFSGTTVTPSRHRAEAMLGPQEMLLPAVFAVASERQQRLWGKVSEKEGNFGLEQLGESREEHARLQHDLAVLEQLGVVVREAGEDAYSWRHPDPELELLP
ncbi:MAG TPA: hypothetical protein VFX85_03035 [Solirubrobacterales bacterium]|nr:hypothetical protein [Solirubrobacterales bacterium]